jgi:metal-responsive CopG/Arc/MetJ family transcriptional regulator
MKVRTSITVDSDLLRTVDRLSKHKNRSAFIEAALETYVAQVSRKDLPSGDLEIINRCAEDLNKEALDVLDYQVAL